MKDIWYNIKRNIIQLLQWTISNDYMIGTERILGFPLQRRLIIFAVLIAILIGLRYV